MPSNHGARSPIRCEVLAACPLSPPVVFRANNQSKTQILCVGGSVNNKAARITQRSLRTTAIVLSCTFKRQVPNTVNCRWLLQSLGSHQCLQQLKQRNSESEYALQVVVLTFGWYHCKLPILASLSSGYFDYPFQSIKLWNEFTISS